MSELTAEDVREIAEEVLADTHYDCATDYDIEELVENAVNEHLAEYQALLDKVDALEKELKDQNYWKADRNHSHSNLENKLAEHEAKTSEHGVFWGF